MNLSDEISRLAESYDPDREADAQASRALAQGILVGTMLSQSRVNNPHRVLKVNVVEQDLDAQGNYNHYFVVETENGHRIKVTVEVE